MKIGIPRAGMYYRYGFLWKSFFDELGVGYIVSPPTDKGILEAGSAKTPDESCLSSKIYMGHVIWLLDKSDTIFLPWISNFGADGINCTRFRSMYSIVWNTFRDREPDLLTYRIDYSGTQEMPHASSEEEAFISMGKPLGKSRSQARKAYRAAKERDDERRARLLLDESGKLNAPGLRVLLAGHDYIIHDAYIGRPVFDMLSRCGVTVIDGSVIDRQQAQKDYLSLTNETLPWTVSREIVASVCQCRNAVDGIMLLSSFPCGPDSIVTDLICRRVRDKPILDLLVDGQDGDANIATRIESFVDIMKFRRAPGLIDGGLKCCV